MAFGAHEPLLSVYRVLHIASADMARPGGAQRMSLLQAWFLAVMVTLSLDRDGNVTYRIIVLSALFWLGVHYL